MLASGMTNVSRHLGSPRGSPPMDDMPLHIGSIRRKSRTGLGSAELYMLDLTIA